MVELDKKIDKHTGIDIININKDIKKHEYKAEPLNHESSNEGFTFKKIHLWQILTAVFAVLFVLSVFTNALSFLKGGATGGAVIDAAGKLSITILNDKRCADCDTSNLKAQLTQLFPAAAYNELDYSSKQGKELYEKNQLDVLPSILFTDAVRTQSGYANVQQYLVQKGSYLELMIGSTFDPKAEICDNKVDDDNNGKIDCEDSYCSGKMICRQEIKNKLDVFVMSQCPYGTAALDAVKEVLNNFKKANINFNINYIANENPDGSFSSLHGQPEVDENIREICAAKYYPDNYKYMDYVWCRNKNIRDANWEPCAKEAFGASDKIKACFEGDEGRKLLSENIKKANELGIGASPTWLANNKKEFSGIDAETIKQNFCSSNPGTEGCSNTLTGNAGAPAGGCGG